MKGSEDAALKQALKQMIVEACNLEGVDASGIDDDEYLGGPESRFGLDSLDALELIVAIKARYGVHIQNDAELREALASVNSFADFLQPS